MTIPVFESQNTLSECRSKRPSNGLWINFIWEPGLSINGETCMSINMGVLDGEEIIETRNTNGLVESIRLSAIGVAE